ncbi:MAG: N-acetyltransferase, partial [Clostridiales bacterium]|nr:N-acetyltransferase [Clostridiales bacterium]
WVIRLADGYTRRSNSVYPLYKNIDNASLDEKINYCQKVYSDKALPTLFRLSSAGEHDLLDAKLAECGYLKDDEAALRVMDLAGFEAGRYLKITEHEDMHIEYPVSEKWLDGYFYCSGAEDSPNRIIAKKLHENMTGRTIHVMKQVGGKPAGCGVGIIERDFVGVFSIIVHKEQRGKGYGLEIMAAILGEAVANGADKAYLQVLAGNIPAEKMYDKLGFHELYRYWYRKRDLR